MADIESPFEGHEIWLFDDLNENDRKQAKEGGCLPGKAYVGAPFSGHEIPLCPYCDVPVWHPRKDWEQSRCQHLVFAYDINTGFSYLHPDFPKIFWDDLINIDEEPCEALDADELTALKKEGKIPDPENFDYELEMEVFSFRSHFGDTGLDCAFWFDGLS